MQKFLIVSLTLFLLAGIGFAKEKQVTVKGYLIDNVCIKVNKETLPACVPTHTKQCALMPACAESGYALYTENDGELIPLTKKSNKKALAFLKNTESTVKVVIVGKKSGKYLDIITINNQ